MATNTTKITSVRPAERIDNLAYRTLGDPYEYPSILEANPFLDIWDPKPGQEVIIPNEK